MIYQIQKSDKVLKGEISLDGSKSISNRVLLIRALCDEDFEINNLSTSKDTTTLDYLLRSDKEVLDAGAAGTTFRFLTAYLALGDATHILTGSSRMKERPIGKLVTALNQLGANITYLDREGFPPLKINPRNICDRLEITIDAGISSQFISALLMIGPCLPKGLKLKLRGKVVSRPYIEMTLKLMTYFNIHSEWKDDLIIIEKQKYVAKDIRIESDWSAASYYYALATFADEADLRLNGLFEDSVQGDAVIAEMMKSFGIRTDFMNGGIKLTKTSKTSPGIFEYDFVQCPDLAQTLAVICAGTETDAAFTGLSTLKIKETDRVNALMQELEKVSISMERDKQAIEDAEDEIYSISGALNMKGVPRFSTYEDHRMALAFATLSIIGSVEIEAPEVVVKSYGKYWSDLQHLGFEIGVLKS